MAGQGFVYGIVDNFPDQMMQALGTGRTDIHTGPQADCLQALQYVNR